MGLQRSNRELWLAFITIVLITLVYLSTITQVGEVPAASGLFGHGLGIVGFILMLMTETLYTLRKRSRSARWGKMSTWLRFHIFTGLVGPYMVLLHSSWKFNGLAGVVMLLTVVIVLSGIVGRYIYTAVPRTADGVEVEATELGRQIQLVERALQAWQETQPDTARLLAPLLKEARRPVEASPQRLFTRAFEDAGFRIRFWLARLRLRGSARFQAAELETLIKRKRTLQRQVNSLIMTRRLMSIWHAIHIPIGLALFSTAFVHILGALYYATLLR